MDQDQLLADFPALTAEHIRAAYAFAAARERRLASGGCWVKLLLDENLSHRLVPRLEDAFPGTAHVEEVELRAQADTTI